MVNIDCILWARRKKSMGLLFFIRILVLSFLIASSLAMKFQFANGGYKISNMFFLFSFIVFSAWSTFYDWSSYNFDASIWWFCFADMVKEKGRRLGRTGITPPVPTTNIQRNFHPPIMEKWPWCSYSYSCMKN